MYTCISIGISDLVDKMEEWSCRLVSSPTSCVDSESAVVSSIPSPSHLLNPGILDQYRDILGIDLGMTFSRPWKHVATP